MPARQKVSESAIETTRPTAQAVRLDTGGPTPLPSDWPMQIGIALLVVAVVAVVAWWVWTRADAMRAADWLLRTRFCRSIAQWRAVSRIAEAANAPAATVLISQTAFERGAKVIVESKSPAITPVVIDRLRERAFGAAA